MLINKPVHYYGHILYHRTLSYCYKLVGTVQRYHHLDFYISLGGWHWCTANPREHPGRSRNWVNLKERLPRSEGMVKSIYCTVHPKDLTADERKLTSMSWDPELGRSVSRCNFFEQYRIQSKTNKFPQNQEKKISVRMISPWQYNWSATIPLWGENLEENLTALSFTHEPFESGWHLHGTQKAYIFLYTRTPRVIISTVSNDTETVTQRPLLLLNP